MGRGFPVGLNKTRILSIHFDHENNPVYSTGNILRRNLNSISSLMGARQKDLPIKQERAARSRQQASVQWLKNPHSLTHGNFIKRYQKEKKLELQKKVFGAL